MLLQHCCAFVYLFDLRHRRGSHLMSPELSTFWKKKQKTSPFNFSPTGFVASFQGEISMSYRWDSASNCSHVGWNMHRYSNRMPIKVLLLLFTLLCFCCSTAPNFAQKGFGPRSNACRLVQNARKMPLPLTSLAFLARIMWTGIKQQPHGEDSSYTHERVTRLSTSIAPEWPFPFVWSSFLFLFFTSFAFHEVPAKSSISDYCIIV